MLSDCACYWIDGATCNACDVSHNLVSHRSGVSAREQEPQSKPAVESDGNPTTSAPDGRA